MCRQNTVTITRDTCDFPKMVITTTKATFAKLSPKNVISRGYKRFGRDKFKRKLETKIDENSSTISEYYFFVRTFSLGLNKYAPIKINI